MTQSIANLITVHSKEERLRSVMKTLVLALLALASLCGAPGACWALHDQFGAEMMQQNRFVASAAEFDQKRVWVCAGLVFEDGVAQLGWAPGFPNEPKVCVEPVPTSNDPYGAGRISILRQFDHTRTICVHGIYRRDPKPRCPNGVIFAASLGMSFE